MNNEDDASSFSNSSTSATYFPKVSVLLAVRNEEQNIERCLTALAKQEYSNIEVWIGDDMSTDKTAFLVQEFCAKYPHFHYFLIQKSST